MKRNVNFARLSDVQVINSEHSDLMHIGEDFLHIIVGQQR